MGQCCRKLYKKKCQEPLINDPETIQNYSKPFSIILEENEQSGLSPSGSIMTFKQSLESSIKHNRNGHEVISASGTSLRKKSSFDMVEVSTDIPLKIISYTQKKALISKSIKVSKMVNYNKVSLSMKQSNEAYQEWRLIGFGTPKIEDGAIVIINHVLTRRNLTVNEGRVVCGRNEQSVNRNDYWRICIIENNQVNIAYLVHVYTQLYLVAQSKAKNQHSLTLSEQNEENAVWIFHM